MKQMKLMVFVGNLLVPISKNFNIHYDHDMNFLTSFHCIFRTLSSSKHKQRDPELRILIKGFAKIDGKLSFNRNHNEKNIPQKFQICCLTIDIFTML